MQRIRLRPISIFIVYGIMVITIVTSLMYVGNKLLNDNEVTYITSGTITDDIIPVISEKEVFIKPYTDDDIKILKNYYDYKSDKKNQEQSLILYENTYLQNSGIDYGKEDTFDVLSIYNGKVLNIVNDDILGKTIEVQYSNNLVAYYQCLGNIKVKKDDDILKGQIIATSGTCNISKDIGNHLHLEIAQDGKIINPETIYEKTIEEINID